MIHNEGTEPEPQLRLPLKPQDWTVDDVFALPEGQMSRHWIELVDGTVLVNAWPPLEHAW